LLHILSFLTATELIFCRAVNRRLNWLCGLSGRNRVKLKLFGSIQDVETYTKALLKHNLEDDPYYSLVVDGPSKTTLGADEVIGSYAHLFRIYYCSAGDSPASRGIHGEFLATLFPNIQHLVVAFSRAD